MRFGSLLLAMSLSTGAMYATSAVHAIAPSANDSTLDSPFTLQTETQVPGRLLKPGSYRMAMKDHLSDRAILQVLSDSGKVESTFLGIFHTGMQSTGNTGPITLTTTKGHPALRGFTFPGGGTIEFAYPKAEAAALASKSTDKVLAIDPASDNLKSQGASLSSEDAQVVTLWSLQATRISPDAQPAIAASKFVSPGVAPAAMPTVARVAAPAPAPVPPVSTASVTPAPRKRPAPAPAAQVASAPRRPQLTALPHTASNLPLLLLTAMFGFAAAGVLRLRRFLVGAR